MNLDKYFRTDKSELRLIDLVTALYLFNVILYTADDFKRDFPGYIILMGLVMHGLFLLVIVDKKNKIKIQPQLRGLIEKFLPFGLIITYSLSYKLGLERGISMNGLPIFLVAAIPVILFLFSSAFKLKFLYFLVDRKKVYTYGFLGLIGIAYIWMKFSA